MASKSKVLKFPGGKEQEVNFKIFAQLVASGDLEKASACLETLLGASKEIANRACVHFSELFVEDANAAISQTMEIRTCLAEGRQNDALIVIQKVFGVSGLDLINALEAIKKLGV